MPRRSSLRDALIVVRLYFFWYENDELIVPVISVPEHYDDK